MSNNNKKPSVYFGEDKQPKTKEVEKKESPYKKKLAISYTIVYNKETKRYDLLTTNTDTETLVSTSNVSEMKYGDTKAGAFNQLNMLIINSLKGDDR